MQHHSATALQALQARSLCLIHQSTWPLKSSRRLCLSLFQSQYEQHVSEETIIGTQQIRYWSIDILIPNTPWKLWHCHYHYHLLLYPWITPSTTPDTESIHTASYKVKNKPIGANQQLYDKTDATFYWRVPKQTNVDVNAISARRNGDDENAMYDKI